MKTCYYKGVNGKYGWNGRAADHCIMSVVKNKVVNGDMLERWNKIGVLSDYDLFVIRSMDIRVGSKKEVKHLREMGKKLGVRILKK